MKKIFLFLSKTDSDVIRHCPHIALQSQVSLGVFVLLTGLFAFISGSYAVSTMFIKTGPNGLPAPLDDMSIFLACCIGMLYGITIMAIDREIVSAYNKSMVAVRIPLALMIGVVVAVPMEMKIMDAKIEKQLRINHIDENIAARQKRSAKVLEHYNTEKTKLEKEINDETNYTKKIETDLDAEEVGKAVPGRTQIPGRGPAYRQLDSNYRSSQTRLRKKEDALARLQSTENHIIDSAENIFRQDTTQQCYDFLARYQAMQQVIKNDPSGASGNMSLALTLLFIIIELTPALIKLFKEPNEYDAAIETRRRLNIQMTHSIGREGMEEMEKSAEKAMEKKPSYIHTILQNIMP